MGTLPCGPARRWHGCHRAGADRAGRGLVPGADGAGGRHHDWELARMLAPERAPVAVGLGVLAGLCVLVARYSGAWAVLPLVMPAALGAALLARERPRYAGFSLAIVVASWGLSWFRDNYGMTWLFWLVLVVIARTWPAISPAAHSAGPKFWPRISPKKTWSGTVAGWLGGGGDRRAVHDLHRCRPRPDLDLGPGGLRRADGRHRRKRGQEAGRGQGQLVPVCRATAGCGTGSTGCWGRRW